MLVESRWRDGRIISGHERKHWHEFLRLEGEERGREREREEREIGSVNVAAQDVSNSVMSRPLPCSTRRAMLLPSAGWLAGQDPRRPTPAPHNSARALSAPAWRSPAYTVCRVTLQRRQSNPFTGRHVGHVQQCHEQPRDTPVSPFYCLTAQPAVERRNLRGENLFRFNNTRF